jgi:hypothetical protein
MIYCRQIITSLKKKPEVLTSIVEYSNIVFSAIFAIEMLLKITANGLAGYLADGFNVFDGLIVVLRQYFDNRYND